MCKLTDRHARCNTATPTGGGVRNVWLVNCSGNSWMLQKVAVAAETSQIQAPTPRNTYGFKVGSQEMAQVKAVDEVTV